MQNLLMAALLAAAPVAVLASPVANAMPAPTAAPSPREVEVALEKRAVSCTYSGSQYATAIKSKASCDWIVLKDLAVPAGVTLDMTGLKDNAVVVFSGKTTFASEDYESQFDFRLCEFNLLSSLPGNGCACKIPRKSN